MIPMLFIGLCMGCASTDSVNSEQLKYSQWQLEQVNGVMVPSTVEASMGFIEALQINGFAGCNKFFGEGVLEQNRLTVNKLGKTRKQCSSELNTIEKQLLNTLKNGADVSMQNQKLVMQGEQELIFKEKLPL